MMFISIVVTKLAAFFSLNEDLVSRINISMYTICHKYKNIIIDEVCASSLKYFMQ